MSLTLNEYRAKLIKKILFAGSREDVQRFINAAIKALEKNKLNGHLITRFVDKMIGELEQFNLQHKNAQQCSNISYAAIIFNRMKQLPGTPVQ